MPKYTREQLIQRIIDETSAAGLDPSIAVTQLKRESVNFADRYVYGPDQSPQAAKGLAQFLDGTWARFGEGGNVYDPDDAIRGYINYMRFLLNRFGGDYRLALAGYHAGEGDAVAALRNPAGNPKTNAYVNEIMASAGSVSYNNNAIDFSLDESSTLPIVALIALGLYLIT